MDTVSSLDDFIPRWHLREVHRLRVDLDPGRVMTAAAEVTWAEARLARLLCLVVGNRVPAGKPIIDTFGGLAGALDQTPDELVFGTIDALGGDSPPRDRRTAEEFRGFTAPGHAKIAFNFRYAAGVLSTETRVALTDARSRRKFALYWLLIRAGSGLTRISMLHAIRRRATRAAAG